MRILRRSTWARMSAPPGTGLAVLVALVAATVLTPPRPVAACSCGYVAPRDALAHADAVVVGEVRAVAESPARRPGSSRACSSWF